MEVAGRETEREVAATFLAAGASAPALLTLDGDPGIGKSTLCRHLVRRARESGSTVLECRPAQAEQTLSFAALTDLLSGVDETVLATLPAPQYDALAVATLRAAPGSEAPEPRVIGTGLLSLITQLAAEEPLVLVVDDEQWLDAPTRRALTFALRRVDRLRVGLVTSRRTGSDEAPLLGDELAAPSWKRTLHLEGMTAGALFHVVRQELGITLGRPTLIRITEASGGNPFLALELARNGLVVPERLYSLTANRIAQLPAAAQEAVLAVACAGRPTTRALTSLGLREALTAAEDAGVVEVLRGRVTFSHPLLGAAVLESASLSEQRAMHGRLAAHESDPEARARNAALSTPDPDPDVAAALDDAVTSAMARGAADTATDLARLAVDRTEDDRSLNAWQRRVRLAELLHVAGATAEAGAVLERIAEDCPTGPVKARGWLVLTEVAYQTSSTQSAVECARHALDAVGDDDPRLRARTLLSLATLSDDADASTDLVRRAQQCLDDNTVDDPQLRAWALCEQVSAEFHLGHGLDREALDRALALERTGRSWRSSDQVVAIRPVLLKWADDVVDARDALVELHAKALDEGNEGVVPYTLGHLTGVVLRLGRADDAADLAAQHLDHAESTGQESQRAQALVTGATVDAHCGRLVEAQSKAEQVLAWAEAEHDEWMLMSAAGLLGFIALTRQETALARQWLDRWSEACASVGAGDPGISRFHADHVEALLAAGETDGALARLAILEARAERSGRRSAQAAALRCRGLITATGGDLDGSLLHFRSALALHDSVTDSFERARTLLALGATHRRAKAKRAAAGVLTEAHAEFVRVGAVAWAVRTEAELARVTHPSTSSLDLTPSERRIAELAGSGLTNRQVAEQAFVSPKTVEANLARVYRKLGIKSRAELGAAMASGGPRTSAT